LVQVHLRNLSSEMLGWLKLKCMWYFNDDIWYLIIIQAIIKILS
jgi:hypothetical protein